MRRLHLSRDWISRSGPHKQRRTTLVFVLRAPTLVELVVVQVSPDCRRIGRFRVRGHRGVNRVRFHGRVGRHRLGPGTYRIVPRTLPSGRQVADTRLVVVQRATSDAIRAARGADSCARAAGSASVSGTADPAAGAPRGAARPKKVTQPTRHRGVLGAKFAKGAFSAAGDVPLWVYVLLGLSIALLGAAAALPKAAPAGLSTSLLCGLTGAAILLGLTIAYALS